MGVDPGVASMGIAILEKEENQNVHCLDMKVVETTKAKKKDRSGLRVSTDDARRFREIRNGLCELWDKYQPHALSFEVYSPYGKRGGGAWKTSRVEGGIQMFGLDHEMLVLPFLPADVKLGVCGKRSASKEAVVSTLMHRVEGFAKLISYVPRGKQEHVGDATGLGYIAFEEMYRLRSMMGY